MLFVARKLPSSNGSPGGAGSNVAVTVRLALIVTWHCSIPEQPLPLHPENIEPDVAV
jgi:hypothetical protein